MQRSPNATFLTISGKIDASIEGGHVGTRLIDLGGENVVRCMFSGAGGSGGTRLVCAVAELRFDSGKGEVKSLVFETENVLVIGNGDLDLAADSMALSFTTRPKKQELVDVATPFTVSGKLSAPELEIAPGVKSGRVVGEVLTAPFNVLGLLLPRAASEDKRQPCVVDATP